MSAQATNFDHAAAAAQIAGVIGYAGEAYQLNGHEIRGVAEDVAVEDQIQGEGIERRLIVDRAALGASLPPDGASVAGPDGFNWRVIAREPGPPGAIALRLFRPYR